MIKCTDIEKKLNFIFIYSPPSDVERNKCTRLFYFFPPSAVRRRSKSSRDFSSRHTNLVAKWKIKIAASPSMPIGPMSRWFSVEMVSSGKRWAGLFDADEHCHSVGDFITTINCPTEWQVIVFLLARNRRAPRPARTFVRPALWEHQFWRPAPAIWLPCPLILSPKECHAPQITSTHCRKHRQRLRHAVTNFSPCPRETDEVAVRSWREAWETHSQSISRCLMHIHARQASPHFLSARYVVHYMAVSRRGAAGTFVFP